MAKKSKDVYGADGQSNLLTFDPAKLTLVTDESSPLYDPRVNLPVDEAMARNIDYQGVIEPIGVSKNPETVKPKSCSGASGSKPPSSPTRGDVSAELQSAWCLASSTTANARMRWMPSLAKTKPAPPTRLLAVPRKCADT